MSTGSGAICASCEITRPMDQLIAFRDRHDPKAKWRYCCRPSSTMPTGGRVSCFTNKVRSSEVHEILLATDVSRDAPAEPKSGRRGFDLAAYHPTALGMGVGS